MTTDSVFKDWHTRTRHTNTAIENLRRWEKENVLLRVIACSCPFFIVTGSCAATSLRMFKIMNVACISESTFYRHVSSYVSPVIIKQWKDHQEQLLSKLGKKENGVVLAGDGRCDSPGYCTKYGSFTLIEQEINRVVDFQLVQVCTAL